MNLSEATEIVRETQKQYLRGTLSAEAIADVLSVNPEATKDWDRLKLNLQVRKRKLLKRAKDVRRVFHSFAYRNFGLSLNKSRKRIFKPTRSESKELKKQVSAMAKIKRKFFQEGLQTAESVHQLLEWTEFVSESLI